MSEKAIEQMDLQELRKEVLRLSDQMERMRRTYEDLLYNLDNDNFSGELRREKEGMKTQIAVNADGIRSEVSRAYSAPVTVSDTSGQANWDTNKMYFVDDGRALPYFYHDGSAWVATEYANIWTVFEQRADKFYFKGNVVINGNLITQGTISGDRVKGGAIVGTKFYDGDETGYLDIGTDHGYADFAFVRSSDDQELFRVYDAGATAVSGVALYLHGYPMIASGTSGVFRLRGTWDFSDAQVILPE